MFELLYFLALQQKPVAKYFLESVSNIFDGIFVLQRTSANCCRKKLIEK